MSNFKSRLKNQHISHMSKTLSICDMMTHANKVRQRHDKVKKMGWRWFYMMVSWWEIYVSIFHEKRERNIERKKRIWKGILHIVEMIREKKNSGYFVCGIIGNRELEVILWVSWRSQRFLSNYFRRKKMTQ